MYDLAGVAFDLFYLLLLQTWQRATELLTSKARGRDDGETKHIENAETRREAVNIVDIFPSGHNLSACLSDDRSQTNHTSINLPVVF